MAQNFWQFIEVLFLGGAIALFIYWVVNRIISENYCAICEKPLSENNPLVRCTECKKLFCENNHEKIEDSYTSTGGMWSLIPSIRTPETPCGAKYFSMGKLEDVRCNKHSKRIPYSLNIPYKK